MPISFHLFFIFQLLVVSYLDLKFHKIKNYWPLLNIFTAVMLYLVFSQWGYDFTWELFYFPLLAFLIGFVFFAIGLMGAGDSKYLVSIFLVLPQPSHFDFFKALLMATVIYTFILLLSRIIRNLMKKENSSSIKEKIFKNVFGKKDAYAPAILLAWILWEREIIQKIF